MFIKVSLRQLMQFENAPIDAISSTLANIIKSQNPVLIGLINNINPRFDIMNCNTLEECKAQYFKEWTNMRTYSFKRHGYSDICDMLAKQLNTDVQDIGVITGSHPYKGQGTMNACYLYLKSDNFQAQSKARVTNSPSKIAVFKSLLDEFETPQVRAYCEDMIVLLPDYLFTMPSSTSGKYHSPEQCETYGQIVHILAFGYIMNTLLRLEYNQIKYPNAMQRDLLRCTPILHDGWKCGKNGSKFSVGDHPKIAADWIRQTVVAHDINSQYKFYLADLVESHTGQWNTTKEGVTLKKPQNDAQMLVHECDMLSSRRDLHYYLPEDVLNTLKNMKFLKV